MSHLDHKPDYRRNLPHIQPAAATLFVTCRLAGSLPRAVVAALREEAARSEQAMLTSADTSDHDLLRYRLHKRAFGRFDAALDQSVTGPNWLTRPAVAAVVVDSLHYLDGKLYVLDAFTILSNHMHVILTPLLAEEGEVVALQQIMHSLKRYTAREANRVLGRTGQFWQHESYDHVVRDAAELGRIRKYVLYNPVRAGLVDEPRRWPYSWANWW